MNDMTNGREANNNNNESPADFTDRMMLDLGYVSAVRKLTDLLRLTADEVVSEQLGISVSSARLRRFLMERASIDRFAKLVSRLESQIAELEAAESCSYQVFIRDAGTYDWDTCYYWNAPEAQTCGQMDNDGAAELLENSLTAMLVVLPVDEQIDLLTCDLSIEVYDAEGQAIAEHTRRADHYCRGCGHVSSWLDDDHDCEAG